MASSYVDGTFSQTNNVNKLLSQNLNFIEGMPYQFMTSVDNRINSLDGGGKTRYGRKYSEKILSRMPLLYLTPCEPYFLGGKGNSTANNVFLGALLGGTESDNLLSVLSDDDIGSNRYYTAKFASADYYKFLNMMLNRLADFMGIGEEEVYIGNSKVKLSCADWSLESDSMEFSNLFYEATAGTHSLYFYCDAMDTISESFTNDTTQSSLASQINGYSDQVKELQFLMGGNSGGLTGTALNSIQEILKGDDASGIPGFLQTVAGAISGIITGDNSLTSKLMGDGALGAIAAGGKLIFPEIWSDSSYSKSYSIDIKLRSPDHDSLSIYLNILKPYCKLLALTMPRIYKNEKGEPDPNGYGSPFLVKASAKGKFSIDMGIITGLSATKGASCAWNDDGLPTQIDVSLDIKDLYSSLAMSGYPSLTPNVFTDFKNLMNTTKNSAYMDFLANMAGLNVCEMLPFTQLKNKYYTLRSAINEIPSTINSRISQSIANAISKISWIR